LAQKIKEAELPNHWNKGGGPRKKWFSKLKSTSLDHFEQANQLIGVSWAPGWLSICHDLPQWRRLAALDMP
jgi:hypothetical protein